MAYTSGDIILDDEYNVFVTGNADGTQNNTNNNVNTVLGTGSGDRGYGQAIVSPVVAPAQITATQWATMLNKITTLANHQGTSITAITNPTGGDTIAVMSALSSNIAAITTNRHNAAASGSAVGAYVDYTTPWHTSLTNYYQFDFGTHDRARYFFNAGGRVSLYFTRTGDTPTNKNLSWTNLCNACGTLHITGASASKTIAGTAYTGFTKTGGSGTPSTYNTTIGFDNLTGSYQTQFIQYASTAPYTSNYIHMLSQYNGTGKITVLVYYVDNANSNTDEPVSGTLRTYYQAYAPSTTYLSDTWGTVSLSTVGYSGS